jgi:hypothetical protein
MTKQQYKNATGIFSTQLAIGSFVIGTILLLLYLFTKQSKLIEIGLFYIIIAFIANSIMLIWLLYHYVSQTNQREYFAIKILILLANIPIAFFYFCLTVKQITTNSLF